MDYDEDYGSIGNMFGADPEPILVRFWHLLDRALPAVDVGCGQGRNTLFLARHQVRMDAVDPSRVGLNALEKAAGREDLPVRTVCGGFQELAAQPGSYGGVLAFGLIPDFPCSLVDELVHRVHDWTAPSGLVWLTAFTTADPRFEDHRTHWSHIGLNSFQGPNSIVRTYLEAEEMLSLMAGFEVIHYWEGLGPEHCHGNSPPERHAKAEGVFRKP